MHPGRDPRTGGHDIGPPRVKRFHLTNRVDNRSVYWWAIFWFLVGVLATLLGIFMTSTYEPILRITHADTKVVPYSARKTAGGSLIESFVVESPEIRNVGFKVGSIAKCTVAAFGTHSQPRIEVTHVNSQRIRPFEALPADIHFRATFTPTTGTLVNSWKIECYDNLGQFAFRLRVPALMPPIPKAK